ncbi:MAG: hypothetical protein NTW14_01575 [bacterium]|nr:hypothetical protein [bacterium]
MRDRLTSLKFFRNIRNLLVCLFIIFMAESIFLFFNVFVWKHHFIVSAGLFLIAAILSGYLAYYYHGRFHSHE